MADFYKNAQWPEFSQKIFSCTRFYCIFSKNLRLYTIFFAIKNDRTIYIQSAYILTDEDTIRREYSPLEAINDNYEKIVVSLDDLKLPSKEGIIHIQAWDLLSHLQ